MMKVVAFEHALAAGALQCREHGCGVGRGQSFTFVQDDLGPGSLQGLCGVSAFGTGGDALRVA